MILLYTFYGPGSNLGEDKNFFIMIKIFLIKNLTIKYIHFVQLLFKKTLLVLYSMYLLIRRLLKKCKGQKNYIYIYFFNRIKVHFFLIYIRFFLKNILKKK